MRQLTIVVALLLTSVVVAQPTLSTQTVGSGCCSLDTPPTLNASSRGGSGAVGFSGEGAPRSQSGVLLCGIPPASPLGLGHGCFCYLDPTAWLLLAPIRTDERGRYDANIILPVGILEGAAGMVVQGVIRDPGMSFGWALTDALGCSLR